MLPAVSNKNIVGDEMVTTEPQQRCLRKGNKLMGVFVP
jgi:hypothetical protein